MRDLVTATGKFTTQLDLERVSGEVVDEDAHQHLLISQASA